MATQRSIEKNIHGAKHTVSRDKSSKNMTSSRSAKTGAFIGAEKSGGNAVETKGSSAGKIQRRRNSMVGAVIVGNVIAAGKTVKPKVKAKVSSPVVKANYPSPTSSPEFTRLLVQCFVDARNAAIDELKALKPSGS